MSCGCRKEIKNDEKEKNRQLARILSEKENRDYLIIEHDGKLYVESEECYNKGGRVGRIVEYIIV